MQSEALKNKIIDWRSNPLQFVHDNFKIELDAWQKKALLAYSDPKVPRLSLQACAGPGKSAILSIIAWHFFSCFSEPGDHPKGAGVSVTWNNLRDNLWAELAKWRDRSEFLKNTFEWRQERIFARDYPEDWFMSARSWSKSANPDEQGRTLSGLHSGYVLCLIDESGDIPLSVLRAAEQTLGNCKVGKIIQAGNPISHDGMLYAAATSLRHLWHVISITADPEDPDRTPRVDIEWAREQIKTHGRDNPWVMAYILGKFPPSSINTLLGVEEVQAAISRKIPLHAHDGSQKRLGVDVARFGDDSTVIFPRQGLVAFRPKEMRNARTNEIAAYIANAKANWGSEIELIDDTGGYGGGVIDSLIQAQHSPIGVCASGKAIDSRFLNKRAECWWLMADWVKRGGCLPNVAELIAELTTPTYTFIHGKFQIEPKDQIKKRLGRSPNYADALSETFALPEMPSAKMAGAVGSGRQVTWDYNPYSDERMY